MPGPAEVCSHGCQDRFRLLGRNWRVEGAGVKHCPCLFDLRLEICRGTRVLRM